jgi:acyl-CoA thioesterase-2
MLRPWSATPYGFPVDELLGPVEQLGDGQFAVPPNATGRGTVFGGQLLAQLVHATQVSSSTHPLRSLHVAFSRPVTSNQNYLIEVASLSSGRNAGSAQVTVRQGSRTCVTGLATYLAPQDLDPANDLDAPVVPTAATGSAEGLSLPGVEYRRTGSVDLFDPTVSASARLQLWGRARDASDGTEGTAAATIAYLSEPLPLAASLLPHKGWSLAEAYSRYLPSVVSHTVWFHRNSTSAAAWWLFDISGVSITAGRVFARGDVFSQEGLLMASFSQENLLRPC